MNLILRSNHQTAVFEEGVVAAGAAPPLTDVDPVTVAKVVFHDLNHDPGFGGEEFQTNLIMPEPTVFLNKNVPACSKTRTKLAAKSDARIRSKLGQNSAIARRASLAKS
jgi:hypothetical protein